jgi:amino acid transporter
MSLISSDEEISIFNRISKKIFGSPKNLNDPWIFHKIALIPLFAWIGLGADGLSSSAYGPEEAIRVLGSHTYLAVFLALATAFTIFIISYAYSRIIEHFPHGGGGYIVATHMLGERAGVISGSALIIDYILTISVSITSCVDSIFSYLPINYHGYKLIVSAFLIIFLIIINIRGVKESITILAPIFLVFLLSHAFLIVYAIVSRIWDFQPIINTSVSNFSKDISSVGLFGILFLLVKAYSMGGGTYTGIEAVSNGLQIMREPRVKTGKKTMIYMATSLAVAASGLYLCYILADAKIVAGKTLNASLADILYGQWSYGYLLAFITIFSEGALLFVGAQAGFIDAPRVMANMAVDSWLPHRFASLSERLTMRNGITIIGVLAIILMVYTGGSISALVVMYSINVFLTFTLSEFGMSRFYFKRRKTDGEWKKHISIHLIGLVLCLTILIITVIEKFTEGGWITVFITGILIGACYLIKNHYIKIRNDVSILETNLPDLIPEDKITPPEKNKRDLTAIQLVGGFNGFGIHTFFSIMKSFPGLYKNFIFVSVGIVDHGLFKGVSSIDDLKLNVENNLKKYVELANNFGFNAEYKMELSTDLINTAVQIIKQIKGEYPNSVVFSGKLSFRKEKFYHSILHNETAFAVQKKLQGQGITNVILPIRVIR